MKYFISFESTTLFGNEKWLLQKPEVCGVLLFSRNILSLETTKKFINEIKTVRPDIKIAVDEEGGIVSRFAHLMPNFSQPYIATLPLPEVREFYKNRSEFLKNIGIDINFAPVVDVVLSENSYMYKRSYGSDIDNVVALSKICIEEQKKAGILSCVKHFPGHGRSTENSHEKLPVVNISQEEWNNLELEVFEDVIKSDPEYVMVGHLLFPQINSQIASVSNYWITNILKGQLNFKGKVISDDICMKGLYGSVDATNLKVFEDVGLDELIISDQKHPILTRLA
ncbi:MAG: glycoside hydrolase family 3 N-terminal domain-containing protein [Patescibacteria group bacterium]|mgnify:FL=1